MRRFAGSLQARPLAYRLHRYVGTTTTTTTNVAPSSGGTMSSSQAPLVDEHKTNTGNNAILEYPYELVDTPESLEAAVQTLSTSSSVALDIEAFCTVGTTQKQLGDISLVQACSASHPVVFVFDVLTLKVPTFATQFEPFLVNPGIKKTFFDCRRDVEALSCQMGLVPRGVLDLQLQFTALQWKLRSVNRRSGMAYVLQNIAGIKRQEGDAAVHVAMTVGNRPVWDIRPLPPHFLEYAAADVRHICFLSSLLTTQTETHFPLEAVERLSAAYVEHYAQGKPVVREADSRPAEVHPAWLERYIGPGGVCAFCNSKGHTEAECFKKQQGTKVRCSFCGGSGHTSRNCFKKFPQLLKCEVCGQLGHTAASCFRKSPCTHCGGFHSSGNCHKHNRDAPYFATATTSTSQR